MGGNGPSLLHQEQQEEEGGGLTLLTGLRVSVFNLHLHH